MKKSIPFEFFAPNQFVYFDIERLALLETISGTTITKMAGEGGATGIVFVLQACQVGLAHHYHKATQDDYVKMIEDHLEKGGTISTLEMVLGRAIVASGIYGKEAANRAMGKKTEEKKDEESGPNAPRLESE